MAGQIDSTTETDRKEVKLSSVSLQCLKAGTPGSNNIVSLGCKVLMVTFADSSAIDVNFIEFSNRYTGSIIISAKFKIQQGSAQGPGGGSVKFKWKRLHTKQLMPHPHYATGAESKFVFKSSEFLLESKSVCALKLVLQQPSVNFTEFAIDNLKIFSPNPSASPSDSLTQWVLKENDAGTPKHGITTIRDFPSLDKVSQALQKMWALGKKTNSVNHDSNQPKRFDKDGSYDINLLTY